MFGAFYHVPIDFGEFGEIGLTGILEVAFTVVEVAEYLDVVSDEAATFQGSSSSDTSRWT